MYIELEKVIGKNLMSIGNTPVELELNKYKKSLIVGKNGCGKSVLIELIIFALYGKPYRKINKPMLINSTNNKNCEVEVNLNIGDNKYKVIRGIKPNIFKIYENDVLIPEMASVDDYQEYLETKILKIDYKTCCQMMIIGSMGYTPFLELKVPERRVFIESILNLQLFSNMNKNLKPIHTEEKTNYNAIENEIKRQNTKIETCKSVINSLESSNDSKIKQIEETAKQKITEYRQILSVCEELQVKIAEIVVEGTEQLSSVISQETKKTTEAQFENSKLAPKIKFFDTNADCSQCGQVIDDAHKESHLNEYKTQYAKNELIIKESSQLKTETDQKLLEINKKKQEKSQLESQLNSKIQSGEYIKTEVNKLGLEKKKLESNDDSTLLQTKQLLNDSIKLVEENTLKLSDSFTKLQVYDKMLLTLKDSGAKADVIKEYIPEINKKVNYYLEKLGLFVRFDLDENFNETLKSRHRDDFKYESFSMGERGRIDLALLFTWREITKYRTGVETNFIIWDELLEIGDVDMFQQLLDLVDTQPKMNCFIISHKQNLEVMFDDVVEVLKVKDFTEIAHS